jgi:hypothetical protein
VTVKRSDREGRWADIPSAAARFALEAAFLIVVAAGAALAGLSPLRIILLMLVAWLLVALIERASSREQARAIARPADDEAGADEARSGFFGRLRRKPAEPLAEPTEPLEERPSKAHVRRLEPEAPVAGVEIDAEEPDLIVEEAPAPAVTKRRLELPGLEEPEPEPEPEPAAVSPPVVEAPPPPPPEPAPVPAAPAYHAASAPAPPPVPREWNIWDLERRARQEAGDPARDEEWTALFVHLRQYANPKGVLPVEFDDLVRESFADLIQAA